MPTFGSFARSLMAARKSEMSEANYAYKQNALTHILPYFGSWPLHEIDIQAVDALPRPHGRGLRSPAPREGE